MRDKRKSVPIQSKRLSFKIAAIYAVAGMAWIFFSDKLAAMFLPSLEALTWISIIKGWLFITVTALLLYHLVSGYMKKLEKSQEILRKGEKLYNSMFENMLNGLAYHKMLFDQDQPRDFIFLDVNSSFEGLTGLKDVVGKKVSEVIPGLRESDPELFEIYGRVALTGKPEKFETYVEALKMWFSISVYSPEKEYFVAVFDNITERKLAEEALIHNYNELQETTQQLKQSRNMLQLIIESVPVRVFWKDSYLRYLGCNTLFARDAGFSQPEQFLGKDDFAMGWREQADRYRADDRQVMESGRPKLNIVEPQTTPAGDKIWLNTSKVPLQMPNGEVFGVLGVYEDITSRHQAEEFLRESEEKFRLVFEKAPLGIMHYDLTSTIIDCNEKFAEIIGAPKEKFLGFNMMQQLGDDKMREAVAASLKGEVGYYEGDYLSVRAGKLTPVRAIYQPIFSSDGAVSGGVAIIEDISERRRAEEERLRFSKLESLGNLAGGIAHDFNNILTAILGNIGLAALDDKISPRVKDRLAQAEAACLRAEALSRQLLTFAKGGAPVKKLFSVPELLKETTVFACVGSPVKCETTFPENLWSIEADPGQIAQVFQNLTINAIQAMPTGGTISVWAENLTLGTDSGLPLGAGRYIKITVQDQGIGIPAEHLPSIFDPYFTTKHKGSGLGLASAYAIVNKHHGHIAVESKIGVGTTFEIYLPAVEQQATPQPAEDRDLPVGTGKILVMDDEEMVREVLGRMLANLGYEVEFARDGGEALEMFIQARASGQAFDAVILDLTVAGGMGGKETMARMLEVDPQLKAIVSSGYSDDPIMADFRKYGFSEVISKPYKITELGKILNKVIMKKA